MGSVGGPVSPAQSIPVGGSPIKKMRVASSQSRLGGLPSSVAGAPAGNVHSALQVATVPPALTNVAGMAGLPQHHHGFAHAQGGFATLSSPYLASPAVACATPMSAVSVNSAFNSGATTPFSFHMQPPQCSVPMSGVDLASVPATMAAAAAAATSGPYISTMMPTFNSNDTVSIDNAGLFAEQGGESLYGARRAHMQSRISWH
ncbi:hypothetical protein EC988_009917, partial [Linderina pennispora]